MPSVLIRVNGQLEPVTPKNGSTWSLEELQGFVGGYIEIVNSRMTGRFLVIDEEGKLKGKPVNIAATMLYPNGDLDPLVGDVLHCKSDEID